MQLSLNKEQLLPPVSKTALDQLLTSNYSSIVLIKPKYIKEPINIPHKVKIIGSGNNITNAKLLLL